MEEELRKKLRAVREERRKQYLEKRSNMTSIEKLIEDLDEMKSILSQSYKKSSFEENANMLLEDITSFLSERKEIFDQEDDINIYFLLCIGITNIFFSNWYEFNRDSEGENYIKFEYLVNLLKDNINKSNIIKSTNEDINQYIDLICSYVNNYNECNLEKCKELCSDMEQFGFWVSNYIELIEHLRSFDKMYIRYCFSEKNKIYNEYILLIWDYLDRLPKEFVSYIINKSDKLYDAIRAVGDMEKTQMTVSEFVEFPTWPLILDWHTYYDDNIISNYDVIIRYKTISNYYNSLAKNIEKSLTLNLEDGKEIFRKKLIELDNAVGEEIFNFIENLKNYDEESREKVSNKVKLYFYTAESLFQAMEKHNFGDQLELSFLCVNYIKGMECFMADGISKIIDGNINKALDFGSNNRTYNSVHKLECGSLVYFIARNSKLLVREGQVWGNIRIENEREKLTGFSKTFYFEWVSRIRNGKMHKSPVINDESYVKVRETTLRYLIEIYKKLKFN